jgi:uncharacterized protein involved in type VI secretion and phage assembly
MDSFMDMTLSGIVSEAVGNSGNGGEVTPKPKFSGKIDYIAQYEETCFEFLNRLSWIYGEWFFYDGITCYFGKQDGNTETVTFESEVTTFDLSANLLPSEMKHYHYLVHDDNEIDKEAPKPETSGYHSIAQAQSSSVYNSKATLPSPAEVLNMNELEAVAKAEKNRATAGMLTVSGTSQTSKVKIGGKILVKLPDKMETTKKEVDTFLVTSVIHEYDLKGDYRNSFTAIPDTVENIPMQPVYFPRAFSQLATVKSNDDEKKLGRVKVEFQWQKDKNKTTNWIRVKTPDAGKSDKVPKNRGFVFIPEKNDIVMIDFEYGDPNRPYVSGSIFSEKVSKGGDDNNKIKSIITRGDSSMTFDDDKGSIVIKDQKGSDSTITFDGNKKLRIEAADEITIDTGKGQVVINMDKNGVATIDAKKEFRVTVGNSVLKMTENDIKLSTSSSVDISADKNRIKGETTMNGGNVYIN